MWRRKVERFKSTARQKRKTVRMGRPIFFGRRMLCQMTDRPIRPTRGRVHNMYTFNHVAYSTGESLSFPSRTSHARLIQTRWRAFLSQRYCATVRGMRQHGTCVICQEESFSVVRCSNEHATCTGCSLSNGHGRCAVCRDVRNFPPRIDATLKRCMHISRLKLMCGNCGVQFDAAVHDTHCKWCPEHKFMCPVDHCRFTFPAAGMVGHISHTHPEIVSLETKSSRDGTPPNFRGECMLILTRHGRITLLVDRCVVTIDPWANVSPVAASTIPSFHGNEVPICVRVLYPSGAAPVMSLTLRQYKMSKVDVADAWSDEIRIDRLCPVLASRENVVVAARVPFVSPYCMLSAENSLFRVNSKERVIPNGRPGKNMATTLASYGIVDLSDDPDPFQPPPPTTQPVAILHLVFSTQDGVPIDGEGRGRAVAPKHGHG